MDESVTSAVRGDGVEDVSGLPHAGAVGHDPREPDRPDPIAIPLLRTTSEPPSPLASHVLIPGGLYVVVAAVGPTPRGTLGMNWVLEHHLEGMDFTFGDIRAEAAQNLRNGLRMAMAGNGADIQVLHVEGVDATHMPAGAVSLSDFPERVADALGGDRFVAGIPCEDHLYVARADTPSAALVSEMVAAPHDCGSDLIPTVLLLEPAGMRILEQYPR
ncbi:hypothetical protein AB0L57_17990 [Nocardia sp. NPDC052254]|uniref:hypothetical protein n=1 Tax=Nocardia sp. NPDC052254 TaxID=3155681 RepID=UPI0034219BDC